MKAIARSALVGAALVAAVAVSGCTAEVEDPGRLPDENLEGAELPEIDVDPAEIRITTDTQVVRVPEVEVNR